MTPFNPFLLGVSSEKTFQLPAFQQPKEMKVFLDNYQHHYCRTRVNKWLHNSLHFFHFDELYYMPLWENCTGCMTEKVGREEVRKSRNIMQL